MASEVGTLRVVCRADREQEAAVLRLRRRLESTARVHLPEALERALGADRRHVFAERVEVRLDFDPRDYDDVTLAALWAARVADAIARARREEGAVVYETEGELYGAAAAQWADTGGLEPAFEPLGCGVGARVASLPFLAAFDTRERLSVLATSLVVRPARLRRVRSRLALAEREAVLAALAGQRRWGDWGSDAGLYGPGARNGAAPPAARSSLPDAASDDTAGGSARVGGGHAKPSEAAAAGDDRTRLAWSAAWRRCARERAAAVRFSSDSTAVTDSGPPPEPGAGQAAAPPREKPGSPRVRDRVSAPHDSAARRDDRRPTDERPVAHPAWLSRHAGLVLLYPWLDAYLSGELPPAKPPPGSSADTGGRLWALAALTRAEPDSEAVLDPLVRALAGDEPARDLAGWRPVPPARLDRVVEPAEEVLASFAEALPGFAGSSPGYVRREFLERDGRVEPAGDGVLVVRLEPAPLDLALARLPYPLAPFSLPWSCTFVPRLRESHA